MDRRGTRNLWLVAAGCVALVGCHTETGSEESSSWYNFSSRRGGHGSGPGGDHAKTPPPRADSVPKALPAPIAATGAAHGDLPLPPKPAARPPPATQPAVGTSPTAPPPSLTVQAPAGGARATKPKSAIGLPETSGPKEREPGTAVSLPTLPEGSRTSRDTRGIDVDIPSAPRPPGKASPALEIELTTRPRSTNVSGKVPIPAPAVPTARRGTSASLKLPGFDQDTPRSAGPNARHLPDLDAAPSREHEASPFRLLGPEGTTRRPQAGSRLPGLDAPGATASARGKDTLPLPASSSPVSRPGESPPLPIVQDALLSALPTPAKATGSLALPATNGTGRPNRGTTSPLAPSSPEASPANGQEPLASLNPQPGMASTPDRAGSPSPALRPGASANPTESRIPLPFRLGEWISDEQAHQLWRAQQRTRTSQEEKLRLTEQERLSQALLRFLAPGLAPQ